MFTSLSPYLIFFFLLLRFLILLSRSVWACVKYLFYVTRMVLEYWIGESCERLFAVRLFSSLFPLLFDVPTLTPSFIYIGLGYPVRKMEANTLIKKATKDSASWVCLSASRPIACLTSFQSILRSSMHFMFTLLLKSSRYVNFSEFITIVESLSSKARDSRREIMEVRGWRRNEEYVPSKWTNWKERMQHEIHKCV